MKKANSYWIIAVMIATLSTQVLAQPERQPNIIVILSDDQGYGDLGRHGNPVLKTPNLDRLYDEGVRFTNFHVSPTCAPTRAALMTGKHEFKSGVTHTLGERSRLNLESVTLAEKLKAAGYATGMFGKWHLGEDGEYRPERRGFDVALTREGVSNRPKMDHWDPRLMLNGEERSYEGFRTDIFFREATSWIEKQRDHPFFVYLPTYSAHVPHDAPPKFIEPYLKKHQKGVAKFLGMLANIDHNVGLLLGKLDEWGIADNTIVIYMNDNGGTGGIGLYNADMRGCKATAWRGGTRAMSLWRWPDHFKPGDVDQLTGHIDVMPTLLELAGAAPFAANEIDGISLVPLLRDHQASWPQRMMFSHMGRWPDGEAAKHKYAFAGVLSGDLHLVRSETCGNPECQGECRGFQGVLDGTYVLGLMLGLFLNTMGLTKAAADDSWIEQYNVTWNTQSENSSGSMPLVGGNMGCNVWVEDNDLLFYFSSPGCRDENGALLKFGRVRIETEPDIFGGADFEQKLNLATGCIEITTHSKAQGETRVKLWVEIKSPIIHVDVDSESELTVKAVYESWRDEPLLIPDHREGNRFLPHYERSLAYTSRPGSEGDAYIYNDVFRPADESVQFVHRMRNDKCYFNEQVEQQELTAIKDKLYDPLTDLTFGGKLVGDGLRFVKEISGVYGQNPFKGWQYQTEKSKQARLKVITHIAQTKTLAEWEKQLEEKIEGRSNDQTAWQANIKWWNQFWARGRIVINADRGEKDEGWQLGRNYNLFRYMLVSGFFANEPTMFNGGVLTFDAVHEGADRYGRPATTEKERKRRRQYGNRNVQAGPGFTPDFRRWGGALTAQNQRLVYWPMLKNGDFDGILPQLDWYLDILPSTKGVVQHYYGIDGCMNAEQPSIIGLIGMSEYGWTSKHTEGTNKYRATDFEKGIPDNGIGHIFQSQLEFSWMMLQYHRFSGKDISTYLPFIEQAVIFYDEYYRMWQKKLTGNELDGRKLMFYPSNALEGHRNSINPTSVIVGLTTVLNGLLALPDELQSEAKKKRWTAMLATIPDYPYGFRNGKTYLRPAANKELGHKVHCPELYPLYPYQIYGLGMDNLDLIKNTMDVVVEKYPHYNQTSGGWNQNLIYYARIGDAETARTLTCDKIGNGPYRFPAFFPGGDYAPDHNVGGSGMIGLQEMLLQTHGDKIRLLPAWPRDWDVDFKLYAPGRTWVECSFKDGKIQSTNVSPLKRDSSIISFYRKDKALKGK